MAEERIVITVREDGSRVVVRNIDNIGTAARRSHGSVISLSGALQALAATLAVDKVRQWLDTWTAARGKVNIFTKSVEETNMMMTRLMEVAQDTRQPLDATVNSFHQLTLASSALGASQNDILKVTASVNKIFAIQGTSVATARGGIIQFGQAMTEGIVRAQEYNSMINAMPLALKVVAQNLDGAGGSVAKLRKMMLDGKLTSVAFFEALKAGGPTIQALFDRSGKTIGQALTVLNNAMTQYIGKMDSAIGFSQKFFTVSQFLAENIQHVANALISIAAPLILRGLWGVVAALRAMGVAAMANPMLAIAGGIAAALTALTLYQDEIIVVQDQQITLGDYGRAAFSMIAEYATTASGIIQRELPAAISKVSEATGGMQISWNDITNFLRRVLNTWIGWFTALPKLFVAVWSNVPAILGNIFATAFNSIKGQAADLINGIVDGINPLMRKLNLGDIARVSFEKSEVKIIDSWAGMAQTMDGIIRESTKADYIGDLFDTLTVKAKTFADQRKKDQADQLKMEQQIAKLMDQGGTPDDFSGKGKGSDKAAKAAAREQAKLENQLRRLLNQIQPMSGAVLEYARAQDILTRAEQKGMITADQHGKYLEMVKNHYRDIVDPIGTVTRELSRETDYLNLNSDARDVAIKQYGIEEELRKKGVFLTAEESKGIKEQLLLLQETNKLSAARDAIYSATAGALEQITFKQRALNEALTSGAITQEYYTGQLARTNVEWATLQNQMGNGDFVTTFVEAAGQALGSFSTLASGVATIMGDTMTSAIDGLSNSIAGAIMNGENLGDTLRNVAKTVVTDMLAALIKLGIQYALNAALGSSALAATTAASAAAAVATAAAWAPAAAAVSLASFGANAGPAVAGMTTAYSASSMLATLAGFKDGGFTGNVGANNIAGVVHGNEYVMDADATRRIGVANLQNLQRGGNLGSNVTVIVNNNAKGVEVRTESRQNDNGSVDVIMTLDSIEAGLATRVASGRGPLVRANAQTFGLSPRPQGG